MIINYKYVYMEVQYFIKGRKKEVGVGWGGGWGGVEGGVGVST